MLLRHVIVPKLKWMFRLSCFLSLCSWRNRWAFRQQPIAQVCWPRDRRIWIGKHPLLCLKFLLDGQKPNNSSLRFFPPSPSPHLMGHDDHLPSAWNYVNSLPISAFHGGPALLILPFAVLLTFESHRRWDVSGKFPNPSCQGRFGKLWRSNWRLSVHLAQKGIGSAYAMWYSGFMILVHLPNHGACL